MSATGVIGRDGVIRDSVLATLPDGDTLLAQRQEITKKLSPLEALFGGNGYLAERDFKVLEAQLEIAERTRQWQAYNEDQLQPKEKRTVDKPTEGSIDAQVRTHPKYVDALKEQITKKAQFHDLQAELNVIEWRLRMRAGDGYLLAREMGLQG